MTTHFRRLIFCSVALFSVGSLCARAGEVASEAIVLKVTGTAQFTLDAQSKPVAIKAGEKLPQGATITTGDKSMLQLQVFKGGVAVIGPKATVGLEKLSVTTTDGAVTKQTALLDVKDGLVRSVIDPAYKKINDYGIRTPKGILRDVDTDYTVNVIAGSTQMFVTTGEVTLTVIGANGVLSTTTIPAGSLVTISGTGVVAASQPASLAQAFGQAVYAAAIARGASESDAEAARSDAYGAAYTAYTADGAAGVFDGAAAAEAGGTVNNGLGDVNPGITIPESQSD